MSEHFKIQNKHEIQWDSRYWFSYHLLDYVIIFIKNKLPSWAYWDNGCEDEFVFVTYEIESLLNNIKEGKVEFPFEEISETDIKGSGYTKEKFNSELIEFLEKLVELGNKTDGYSYVDII